MKNAFFITGLPCSRTAWLSALFSTGPVVCQHDLLSVADSLDDYERRLWDGSGAAKFCGDSDSGLLAAHRQIRARFPDAPWVLVIRTFDRAWESLVRFTESGPWRGQLHLTQTVRETLKHQWDTARAELIQRRNVMEVYFEALEHVEMLERIWKHLVPGARWSEERARALQKLNIRPDQRKTNCRPKATLLAQLSA